MYVVVLHKITEIFAYHTYVHTYVEKQFNGMHIITVSLKMCSVHKSTKSYLSPNVFVGTVRKSAKKWVIESYQYLLQNEDSFVTVQCFVQKG
jgi:predicted nucleotidyltransferase